MKIAKTLLAITLASAAFAASATHFECTAKSASTGAQATAQGLVEDVVKGRAVMSCKEQSGGKAKDCAVTDPCTSAP